MRCPRCGALRAGPSGGSCDSCGKNGASMDGAGALPAASGTPEGSDFGFPATRSARPVTVESTPPNAILPAAVMVPARGRIRMGRQHSRAHVRDERLVTGRVFVVENAGSEPPDLDVCRVLTRLLWFVLFVLSPVMVVYWLLVMAGGLSALIAIIIFLFLLKFITPTNLFSLFHLSVLLNPFRRAEVPEVPVRVFRVRDQGDGAEYVIRMKGRYVAGNIGTDDLMTFEGRWRDGALVARRGYNHHTGSTIHLQESCSWVGLCLTLLVIAGLILLFEDPVAVVASKFGEFRAP